MSAEKKTIEELILNKPITPEIVNRLFYVYNSDWNRYVSMIKRILDQSILSGVQDIKVLVDRIDSVPSCENENYEEKLFTDEKKKIFCMWLFKSHILCVNADERIVGRKIEHDLPVMFKIYLNKNLANRINNISNTTVKIEQYNKAVEKILDQFKTYFNDSDFFFKRIDAATTESNLDSVQICLGFNTYYSEAEHGYIKEFVKEVVTNENKSKESLEQSEEGIGGILLIILAMPWLLAIPLIIIMIIKNKFDNIKDKKDLKEFYKENKKLADELSNVLKNKLKIGNSLKTISTVLRDNCKSEYNYHDIMYDNFSEGYNLNDKDIEDIDNDIGNGILKQIVKTMKNKKTFDKTDLLNIFSDISVNLFVSLIPLKIDNKKDLVNYGSKESPSSAYSNDFIKNTLNKFDKILENIKNKSNIHNLKQIKDTNPRKDLMTYLSEDEDYESSLASDGKNGFSIRIDCNVDFDFSDIVKDIDLSSNDKSKESLDQSSELFGLGKKKSNSIEDVKRLPGYRKDIIEKCHSMFINAWNYKAYKLPTDVGELEEEFENEYVGEELIKRKKECGYLEKIKEFEKFSYSEKIISGSKLMIFADGIFEFAYGQPTEFVGYNNTLDDISKRWGYRLKEKEKIVSQYLSKFYKNCEIETYVGTGDGDEGCVYPQYSIIIPISELEKPIKLTKEEATKAVKNCVKLLKDAFAKNGNPNGFDYYSDSELKKQIEEYLDEDNSYNSIVIGSYDAWKYTDGKARYENEYYKFNDIFIKIENTIKDLMKQSKCPYNISSDGGDWDDGGYTVYFTQKPNLEHEKNYMGSEESLDQSSESILALAFILPILSVVARLIAWIVMKANVKSYNKTFKKLCEKLNKENAKELETIVKEVSAFVEGFIDRTDIMCKEIFKEDTVAAVYNTINYRDPGRIKSKYASASEKTIKESDEYKDVVKNVEQNMANFVERLLKFIIVGKPLKLDNDTSIIRVTCVDNGYNMTEQIATKLDKLFDKVFKCTNGKAKFKIHGKDVTFNYRTCIYGNDYSMYSYITLE